MQFEEDERDEVLTNDDLSTLTSLDEDVILDNLKTRFDRGVYYTFLGDVLVAVNPYRPLTIYGLPYHRKYAADDRNAAPHVYWVAQRAYWQLNDSCRNQCILVSGESGAGKTETTKHLVSHMSFLSRAYNTSPCYPVGNIHEKIDRANPLLEAFGNACTLMNENSSRFGKYLELFFTEDGTLNGAKAHVYILEKSRLVSRGPLEKNFHVFYYMLDGLTDEQQKEFYLNHPETFRILKRTSGLQDRRADGQPSNRDNFRSLLDLMHGVGFSDTDVTTMLTILSAILHLTNIVFEDDYDTDGVHIADEFPLLVASDLLTLDVQNLTAALISNTVFLRGEKVISLKNKVAAEEGRDALAKALYVRLFDWVVAKINFNLHGDGHRGHDRTIGILDMSGFEKFPNNGFEQLCINAANERLHRFFNETIFLMEAADYEREGVDIAGVTFRDNQPVIDLLFKRPSSFFDIMDEESMFPRATDSTFVHKLSKTFVGRSEYFNCPAGTSKVFTIRHYAGEVQYGADGMLERNRDRLGSNLLDCLTGSTNRNISALIQGSVQSHRDSERSKAPRLTRTGSTRSLSKSTAQRLLANRNRRPPIQTNFKLSSFASKQFRSSLDELVTKLSDAQPWFIKCIKPNTNRSSQTFKEVMVMEQLRCNGLLEVAKQRRDGYAVRMPLQEFVDRFRDISFPPSESVNSTTESIERILKDAGVQDYVIGETKVFLRHWQEPYLRDLATAIAQERTQAEEAINPSPSDLSSGVPGESSVRTSPDRDQASELGFAEGEDEEEDELPSKPSPSYRISEWMAQYHASSVSPPSYDPCKPSLTEHQIRTANERKILDPRWWDRFQMMPREHVSGTSPFLTLFKVFKVVCYIFLFVIVLSSAVVNKICVLVMTSSVLKEPLPEADWPMKTMLIISMCVPYGFWFIVYAAKTLFGSSTWPSFSLLSVVLILELMHTFGLCLLVFRVLPMMDMFRAFIVLSSVYTVPALLKTIFEGKDNNVKTARRCSSFILNIGAFVIQVGSIVACCFFDVTMTSTEKSSLHETVLSTRVEKVITRPELGKASLEYLPWELPLSLLLISVSFWENYVDGDFSIFGKTLCFSSWKKHLHHSRARLYIFASVWKAIWIVVFAVLLQSGMTFNLSYLVEPDGQHFNNTNTEAGMRMRRDLHIQTTDANLTAQPITTIGQQPDVKEDASVPFYMHPETVRHFEKYGILYVQILANTILTYFGSTACTLCMQLVGFSFPLILATPVSATVVLLQCYFQFLPTGLFVWVGVEENSDIWILHIAWLGILWLSEVFITSHIWYPSNGRLENLERLFVMPLRCSILTDQSLTLRRRRNDHDASLNADDENSVFQESDVYKADDIVPQIYACATMWHETRAEMTNLLKSIFRMDIDHSGRFLAQKFYKIRDPDYYEFEAHIFFDDAMDLADDDRRVPNMFVADLIDCIDDSLSSVHERQMTLGPPVRSPTPYGGRLTWTLPGGTKLVAHMKDKHKIRHKKRWSQVMYMYYLLGYRILAQPENKTTLEEEDVVGEFQRVKLTDAQLRKRRKAAHFTRSVIFNYVSDEVHTQAENTYILTLDGDVDFHPDAVRLLVDRLKTNKKVGAACGRIHPIGSGPLLWYQQFEYAIGHWLQKATEHVFGCVMCAPGCFSLFRGSALMDDNVARTYATRTTEAGHYVQYDQGEDRWLSTLLLQQGYRIDYCAASDAFTHAPETFSEFFNQRRRWGPSTLANIIDLLGSWKETIKLNDNISTLYIIYQVCMMISTILGPATILLMMAGAYTIVFKTGVVASYALSIVPAIFFILVCINGKPRTQMTIASIMSAIYAIVMTIVLVGTIGQAIEGGFTSPNVIFLVMLVVIFFISALLHPEEFFCVISGALYFICLPTGYLLLTIYFLCNLHIVSWGTREIPKRKSKEQIEFEKQEDMEKRKKKEEKKKGILGWIGINSFFREMGDVLKQIRTDVSHGSGNKTDILLEELIHELRANREPKLRPRSKSASTDTDELEQHASTKFDPSVPVSEAQAKSDHTMVDERTSIPPWLKHEDNNNPSWLQSDTCGTGPVKHLAEREVVFWDQLISRHLHPISEDKTHQEKVAFDLKNLRNNVVFGFFMTSALWIAVSMQLQVLQEELKYDIFFHIPRWDSNEDLVFEPLGLIFLAFFATILLVQFVGMFAHRWGTVLHMLSITDISCGKTFTEKDKVKDIISKAMELQKLSNIENEPLPDYDEPLPDYMDSDEENIFDGASVNGDTMSISMLSVNPPSYHSSFPLIANRRRKSRQGLDIFTRKGHPSGAALRKAFEKRFRNEKQCQVTVHVDPELGEGDYNEDSVDMQHSYEAPSIA